MKTHNLKTHPEYFNEVMLGHKPFELRKNDRDFSLGDVLCLEEWDPMDKDCTGREFYVKVSYIFRGGKFGLDPDMVIMGLEYQN